MYRVYTVFRHAGHATAGAPEANTAEGEGLMVMSEEGMSIRVGSSARNLNAYTFESTLNFLERNYVYTRLELVDRDELLNEDELEDLGIDGHHASFRVGAYTFGGARALEHREAFAGGGE